MFEPLNMDPVQLARAVLEQRPIIRPIDHLRLVSQSRLQVPAAGEPRRWLWLR